MGKSRAKEVSESYKGSEVAFDKTTPGAMAKSFASTDVQGALEEAKPVSATTTTKGIVRTATDAEMAAGSNVDAYAKPKQVNDRIINYANTNIIPLIPDVPAVPSAVYGGSGSAASMQATYSYLPVGSLIVFEEAYTEAYGWGNGTAYRTAYRRRTLCRTSNSGWQFV